LSDFHHNGQSPRGALSPGAYGLAEILSQPECWKRCFSELQKGDNIRNVLKPFEDCEEWLFIGCGSSYYIGLTAAAVWTTLSGMPARAVPASEVVLFPELVLNSSTRLASVLISRSGQTSEVLQAAELLKSRNIPSLAISCVAGQALQQLATSSIILPADERSTVMTRSFTSMLLALQYAAAVSASNTDAIFSLCALPVTGERILNQLPARLQDFATQNVFADFVCLGQGPYYGLACESTLKVTEMSCSYAQAFHTLEFRHGPKSIVNRDTLITLLLSESNYAAEREVLEEIKALGGTTLVVTNRADDKTRKSADFLLELLLDVPEILRVVPFVFAGQLLGLYNGLKKKLDPDNPRNLSRVVVLNSSDETKTCQHASI
jgi:glutamine---fructose-6-phosphate transaminase (isomerizing)